jgi:predicted DNA-binding protein YlxM (UPF0122 family)
MTEEQVKQAANMFASHKHTLSEIARTLNVTRSSVHYAIHGRRKRVLSSPESSLSRFHVMEKAANHLKPPEDILIGTVPNALVEQFKLARTHLDIYMAMLGNEALNREEAST